MARRKFQVLGGKFLHRTTVDDKVVSTWYKKGDTFLAELDEIPMGFRDNIKEIVDEAPRQAPSRKRSTPPRDTQDTDEDE